MSEKENPAAPSSTDGEGPVVTEQAADVVAEAAKPSATGSADGAKAGISTNGSGPPATDSYPLPHPRQQPVQPVQPDDAAIAGSAPPPWRRVPTEDGSRGSASKPVNSAAVDSLLSEVPTAYIEHDAEAETGELPRAEIPVARGRLPRQALLQVKRFDPWSVLKLALVLAVVVFFIWLVAVGVLYEVLDGIGVWDRLNGTYNDLVSGQTQGGGALISAGRVFGIAAVIGAINSVLFAVAITVTAFVYNVSADLVGGVEVTLSERD